MILDRLQATPEGWLPIGERSSPADINREFPGVSKVVFKNALGGLYKKGESRKESQQRYFFLRDCILWALIISLSASCWVLSLAAGLVKPGHDAIELMRKP